MLSNPPAKPGEFLQVIGILNRLLIRILNQPRIAAERIGAANALHSGHAGNKKMGRNFVMLIRHVITSRITFPQKQEKMIAFSRKK